MDRIREQLCDAPGDCLCRRTVGKYAHDSPLDVDNIQIRGVVNRIRTCFDVPLVGVKPTELFDNPVDFLNGAR